jgi:hypothetical protein
MTIELVDDFGPEASLRRQMDLKKRELSGEVIKVEMSSQELAAVNERIKQLGMLLQGQIRAKYKIEVVFGKNRTSRGAAFAGATSLWLSGTKFHGGGDEKLYECPNPECGALIFPHQITQQTVESGEFCSISLCGHCGRRWKSEETIGERFFKLTEQDWAFAILRQIQKLELNADIYLKYSPTDIRYQAMMEMARQRGGEEIAKARKNRGLHIYPLKNIIKDTKHGADLYKRIRTFINA